MRRVVPVTTEERKKKYVIFEERKGKSVYMRGERKEFQLHPGREK